MSDDPLRDPKLNKLYKASRADEPSVQTDAAIKRLAREGLRASTRPSVWYRRSVWAIAASLVLGVTLLMQWPEPLFEAPLRKMVEPRFDFHEIMPAAKVERESVPSEPAMRRAPAGEPKPSASPSDPVLQSLTLDLDAPPEMERETTRSAILDTPPKESASAIEHVPSVAPEQLQDCEEELPEKLNDPAAWHQRIQELIDAGRAGQAECLILLYQEQFDKDFE